MGLTEKQIGTGVDLLIGAIRKPFFQPGDEDPPVRQWLSFLADHFPLWSFRTDAYFYLLNPEVPTTGPLPRILQNVLADEGWKGWDFVGDEETPFSLVENLAARRRELGSTDGHYFSTALAQPKEEGGWRVERATNLRGLTEPEPRVDREDGVIQATQSLHEQLSLELSRLIESREATPPEAKKKRDDAQGAIKDFLKRISARRGRGRTPKGTDNETLTSLYGEGRQLVEIAWNALPGIPSPDTQEILADLGVDEPQVQDLWARRLALPVLSSREINAICEHRRAEKWLTPRRLSILLLARRLDLGAPHVARRVVGSDEEMEFDNYAGDFEV